MEIQIDRADLHQQGFGDDAINFAAERALRAAAGEFHTKFEGGNAEGWEYYAATRVPVLFDQYLSEPVEQAQV